MKIGAEALNVPSIRTALGREAYGWPAFEEAFGPKTTDRCEQWLDTAVADFEALQRARADKLIREDEEAALGIASKGNGEDKTVGLFQKAAYYKNAKEYIKRRHLAQNEFTLLHHQVYRGPVLRHSAEPIQAANFRSAVAF